MTSESTEAIGGYSYGGAGNFDVLAHLAAFPQVIESLGTFPP
jgi:hypothetical protein